MTTGKRIYVTPELTVYGTLRELTQEDIKNKKWGPADDVLLNNQAILHDAGS